MFDRYQRPAAEALLPLQLPSSEALAKERSRLTSEKVEQGHITYLDVVASLSSSAWLMDHIQDYEFMVSLRAFLLEYQLVRNHDKAPVAVFSDRNIGSIMSILRRRGEHYYTFEGDSQDDTSAWEAVGAELERLGFSFQAAPWNDHPPGLTDVAFKAE